MKFFTQDWFWGNIDRFNKHLGHFKGQPNLEFLEIGSFEGKSTTWLLDNILTDESSNITCIDTFEGGFEHAQMHLNLNNLYNIFLNNISQYGKKVIPIKKMSSIGLLEQTVRDKKYDFIYIDGCHESKEVLEDMVLSWQVLKEGGIMILDDYLWGIHRGETDQTNAPKISIDSFMNCYARYIDILEIDYQVVLRKKV
jgi:predicted O-methyltransferase YrrM